MHSSASSGRREQDDGLLPVITARAGEDGGEDGLQQQTPNGAPQARTLPWTLPVFERSLAF